MEARRRRWNSRQSWLGGGGFLFELRAEGGLSQGSDENGAKLRPFLDVFRRRLFDVVGCPFLCGVLSSGGSFSDGVF